MLNRRLQVLIDDDRLDRLDREAKRQRVPVSTLVREAIDAAFPSDDGERRAAARAILAADPMPVPDVDELLSELDEVRGRRR